MTYVTKEKLFSKNGLRPMRYYDRGIYPSGGICAICRPTQNSTRWSIWHWYYYALPN
jgi:hypothetical protein